MTPFTMLPVADKDPLSCVCLDAYVTWTFEPVTWRGGDRGERWKMANPLNHLVTWGLALDYTYTENLFLSFSSLPYVNLSLAFFAVLGFLVVNHGKNQLSFHATVNIHTGKRLFFTHFSLFFTTCSDL